MEAPLATYTYDLTDHEITMPNGDVLTVLAGELTVGFDPVFDSPHDWQPVFATVDLTACDGENEIRLDLPVSHPAIAALIERRASSITHSVLNEAA
jgi:hypothetical protein